MPNKKDRKEYFTNYDALRAVKKRETERERYAKKKATKEAQKKGLIKKLSQASDYQVLIPLKEYTELNPEKKKL
jgi:hypothetical protein